MGKKDLLNLSGLSRPDIEELFRLAAELKQKLKSGVPHPLLARRCLAMIFEKPSLRTRVTFEAGMVQLGGHAVFLGPSEVQLGVRETPADCARSLSRWVDLITVRTFFQETLNEMAHYATVPVINALSDESHPCQVLADCLTLIEHKGTLEGLKVAFVGDGNNVVHSWIEAAERLPLAFAVACPRGYEPDHRVVERAQKGGARVVVTQSVEEAVSGADVVYTDVWASMGQEKEMVERAMVFRDYQVNERVVKMAKPDAVVMHCLPAHRGQEITHEVLESAQSIAFDQAENRLHIQKAIMVWLLQS